MRLCCADAIVAVSLAASGSAGNPRTNGRQRKAASLIDTDTSQNMRTRDAMLGSSCNAVPASQAKTRQSQIRNWCPQPPLTLDWLSMVCLLATLFWPFQRRCLPDYSCYDHWLVYDATACPRGRPWLLPDDLLRCDVRTTGAQTCFDAPAWRMIWGEGRRV